MKRLQVIFALSIVCAAQAGTVDRGVDETAVIQDGHGSSRLLFRWDPSLEEANVAVWKATLRFDLAGEAGEGVLPVVIYPITTPWNAETVRWDGGWATPGGDFDDELFARAEIDLAGRGVSVDVSALAKEVVESGYQCQGFLVTLDPREGVGLSDADLGRLAGLGSASVELKYRSTPPPPRAVIDAQGGRL